MLLQLYPTLSFFFILLLTMDGGIPRAGLCLCRNRRGILWRDMDYLAAASPSAAALIPSSLASCQRAPMAPWAGACCRTRAFGELGRELNAHILIDPRNGGLVNRISTEKRAVPER